GTAYIACNINPDDRRKIDVSLTTEGRKSLASFRAARMASIIDTLSVLNTEERDEFVRLLRKIQKKFTQSLQG
ncbi:MAG TPA: transcriptional regulator, partial [Phycisphaerae bacterium]|nr:transcriptional regulator [Phycisphaerae bacterium]